MPFCIRWLSSQPGNRAYATLQILSKNTGKADWALFRNRMTTLQHTALWIPMFDRVARGTIGDAPEWSTAMEHEFMTAETGGA